MRSMAIRGFIEHDRENGVYALTDSGRATLVELLERAKIIPEIKA
jgi:DNA-binding PadR family transcriptional regulator